jgi:hypothetical protein
MGSADEQQTTTCQIRVGEIAYARSGDKGIHANIGVIAYTPEGFAVLRGELTSIRVAEFFRRMHPESVERYELPNLDALNFVLKGVLKNALRIDPQGKALGQAILEMRITLAQQLLATCLPKVVT